MAVGQRFRKDFGDLDGLAESIADIGLLQPIGVDGSNRLVFGERRLRACRLLGWETIPARLVDLDLLIKGEYAENVLRKDFTVSERVAIGKALEEQVGNRQGQRTDLELVQNSAQVAGEKTRELAAKQAGFGSHYTYDQAKKVVETGAPELVDAMDRGDVSVSAAAQLLSLDAEQQAEIVELPADERKAAIKAHVAHNSGNNEWYTPPEFIDSARCLMGEIDCDPASSCKANETVKAKIFYTDQDDGLEREWKGRVWMNPPYAKPLIAKFCDALVNHYISGRVTEACVLVNNATETKWFRSLSSIASGLCLVDGRVKFLDPKGEPGAPLQGQVVVYLGRESDRFKEHFKCHGDVWVR